MTEAHLHATANHYVKVNEDIKQLEAKKAQLRKELFVGVGQFPSKTIDDKGNEFVTFKDGTEIKLEKRVSTILNQDKAVEYAEEKKMLQQLTHTEVVADMDSFEALNLQGMISDKDLEALVDIKESVALKVKGKP